MQLTASERIMLAQLYSSLCHFALQREKIQNNTHIQEIW